MIDLIDMTSTLHEEALSMPRMNIDIQLIGTNDVEGKDFIELARKVKEYVKQLTTTTRFGR